MRGDLQDIMRAVRGLSSLSSRKRTVLKPLHEVIDLAASEEEEEQSPSERIKNARLTELSEVIPAEASPTPRKSPTHRQSLMEIRESSKEDQERRRPFSPVQIDSQLLSEDESIPIMSLPANWTALETPPKSERRLRRIYQYSPASCSQAPRMRNVLNYSPSPTSSARDVEEYDDDEEEPFGPPLSPGSRTVENGWPEVLVRFENQPDPYPGMFDGNSVCDSDDEV